MKSVIIGIAGGSGSGKSTFTNRIKQYFGDDVAVIYHDNYYRPKTKNLRKAAALFGDKWFILIKQFR